jgi:hypothetical protein
VDMDGQKFCSLGHTEPASTSIHQHPNEGWMVSGQETVFCWVPVP